MNEWRARGNFAHIPYFAAFRDWRALALIISVLTNLSEFPCILCFEIVLCFVCLLSLLSFPSVHKCVLCSLAR